MILANAPYSRYAAVAQFDIGQAKEREGDYKGAISAYQGAVDKYPTDPIAADALYQIGFNYLQLSRTGSNDRNAAQRARENFEDFLAAYPSSERAPQAKENIAALSNMQTGNSLQIADYYYGQKQYRAAVVYYNDVIRQQPNSVDSTKPNRASIPSGKNSATAISRTRKAAPRAPAPARSRMRRVCRRRRTLRVGPTMPVHRLARRLRHRRLRPARLAANYPAG